MVTGLIQETGQGLSLVCCQREKERSETEQVQVQNSIFKKYSKTSIFIEVADKFPGELHVDYLKPKPWSTLTLRQTAKGPMRRIEALAASNDSGWPFLEARQEVCGTSG